MKRLVRLLGLATDLGFLLGVASLFLITLLYSSEVVLRYVLSRPTAWGLDAISFLFLVSIFAVLPHATRSGSHIAVTIVQDRMPRLAPVWNRGLAALATVICLLAGWACFGESLRQAEQSVETMGTITVPKWWLSSFIAYGFGLSALWFLRSACDPTPAEPVLEILGRR